MLPEGMLRSGVWAWRRLVKEETGGRASCPAPIALLSFWVPIHSLGPVPALHPMALFIVQITASKEGFRMRERSHSGGLHVDGGSAEPFPGHSPRPQHEGASRRQARAGQAVTVTGTSGW